MERMLIDVQFHDATKILHVLLQHNNVDRYLIGR
jgi:hypothetical protein